MDEYNFIEFQHPYQTGIKIIVTMILNSASSELDVVGPEGAYIWSLLQILDGSNPPRSPPQGIVAEEIAGLGEQGTKGLQWHTEGMEGRTDAFFRVTLGDS